MHSAQDQQGGINKAIWGSRRCDCCDHRRMAHPHASAQTRMRCNTRVLVRHMHIVLLQSPWSGCCTSALFCSSACACVCTSAPLCLRIFAAMLLHTHSVLRITVVMSLHRHKCLIICMAAFLHKRSVLRIILDKVRHTRSVMLSILVRIQRKHNLLLIILCTVLCTHNIPFINIVACLRNRIVLLTILAIARHNKEKHKLCNRIVTCARKSIGCASTLSFLCTSALLCSTYWSRVYTIQKSVHRHRCVCTQTLALHQRNPDCAKTRVFVLQHRGQVERKHMGLASHAALDHNCRVDARAHGA